MSGDLYHSPADIITQLLIDVGLADAPEDGGSPATGWVAYSTHLPETPDQAIQVKETGQRLHRRNQVTGVMGAHYQLQFLCRSADLTLAYKRVKLINESVDKDIYRETVVLLDEDADTNRAYRVNAITRLSDVIPAGNDGRRFFFSSNALASIELDNEADTGTAS